MQFVEWGVRGVLYSSAQIDCPVDPEPETNFRNTADQVSGGPSKFRTKNVLGQISSRPSKFRAKKVPGQVSSGPSKFRTIQQKGGN